MQLRPDRRAFLLGALACALPACRDKRRTGIASGSGSARGVEPYASPRRIEHVVLVVKENRTYDTIFGDLTGGDGELAGLERCPDEGEQIVHDRKMALRDKAFHRRCRHAPEATPFYHALARSFTLSDRFFSEVRGPSFPNHQVLISGRFTRTDDPAPVETWRCPEYCYGARDAAAGALANMSWVYCDFRDSEHPPASLCTGQHWTRAIVEALVASPQWPRMAIFILWDDWGGFWDHVDPPVIERDADGRPLRWGHRVPLLVVSPWAKRGYISHAPASFLSVVRWAFETLGVPLPVGRIRQAPSLDDCFDMTQAPPSRLVLPPPVPCDE